jgi:hypothetical protein
VFEIQYTDDQGNIISSVYGESAATVAEVWDNDGVRVAVLEFYETWTVRDILPEYEMTADIVYSHRFTSVRDFVAMLEKALETV